jgi:hypothetical protein
MEHPPVRYHEKTQIKWDGLKDLGSGLSSLFMPGWTCLVVQLPVLYYDFALGPWFTAHVNRPATIRGDEILIQLGSREHEEANTQNRRGHCKCILKGLLIAAHILFPDCEKILGMPLSHVNLTRYFLRRVKASGIIWCWLICSSR